MVEHPCGYIPRGLSLGNGIATIRVVRKWPPLKRRGTLLSSQKCEEEEPLSDDTFFSILLQVSLLFCFLSRYQHDHLLSLLLMSMLIHG
jgi:hypothetical protein